MMCSGWPPRHDVSYPLQGQLRDTAPRVENPRALDPDCVQSSHQLGRCATRYGSYTSSLFGQKLVITSLKSFL